MAWEKSGPVLLGAAAAAVTGIAAFTAARGFPFHTEILEKAGALVAGLFVITLFVERSLSVLNDIWYGREREETQRTLQNVREELAFTRRGVERTESTRNTFLQAFSVQSSSERAEALAALGPIDHEITVLHDRSREFANAEQTGTTALTAVEAKQDRCRLQLGFLFSVVISAAGVRTLSTLVQVNDAAPASQLWLFHGADVVLTAGLIAGGTSGINSIAEMIGAYVDATRRKAAT